MLLSRDMVPLAALNRGMWPKVCQLTGELAILCLPVLIIQADLLSCGSDGRRMRGGSWRLINTQDSNYEFLQHRTSNEEQALRQP